MQGSEGRFFVNRIFPLYFLRILLFNWSVCVIEIIYRGSLMRNFFLVVFVTACITEFTFLSAIQAADVPNSTSQRQKIDSGSQRVLHAQDEGLPSRGDYGNADWGFPKRIFCTWHPTTLSYHPQVYNYRYYFNIVGHETFHANSSNYRQVMPAVNQPEEILTPMPEQQNQSPQPIDSARLSRANQKKLQK
jgi:hypothetical protein